MSDERAELAAFLIGRASMIGRRNPEAERRVRRAAELLRSAPESGHIPAGRLTPTEAIDEDNRRLLAARCAPAGPCPECGGSGAVEDEPHWCDDGKSVICPACGGAPAGPTDLAELRADVRRLCEAESAHREKLSPVDHEGPRHYYTGRVDALSWVLSMIAVTQGPAGEPRDPCTGIAASHCPIHGDCTCPRTADGERPEMDAHGCPLHGVHSDHPRAPVAPAEQPGAAAVALANAVAQVANAMGPSIESQDLWDALETWRAAVGIPGDLWPLPESTTEPEE